MNYLKHYCALMRKASKRDWSKKSSKYFEEHHIFPESIFGKNRSLVCLTAREHYIAHILLWKALRKRYGNKDQRTIKMAYAAWRMCFPQGDQENCKVSSKLYEKLRTEISLRTSERVKMLMADPEYKKTAIKGLREYYANNKHPQLGKPRTEEEKRKISESLKGEKNPMWGKVGHRKGMKNSPSHRAGISEARCKRFGNIWKIKDPEGKIYIAKSLKKFCKEHGLGSGHMYNVANGKLKQHKGWVVENAK
jgi:hypothetical protein